MFNLKEAENLRFFFFAEIFEAFQLGINYENHFCFFAGKIYCKKLVSNTDNNWMWRNWVSEQWNLMILSSAIQKENNFPMYLNIGYSPDASKHIYSRSGYQSEDLSGYEIIFFYFFFDLTRDKWISCDNFGQDYFWIY